LGPASASAGPAPSVDRNATPTPTKEYPTLYGSATLLVYIYYHEPHKLWIIRGGPQIKID